MNKPTMDYENIRDPFASAADSRALVEWLATQSVEIQCRFDKALSELLESAPDDLRPLSLWYLTAPLPVIAEAAWKAITASSTAAQVSAEHSAGQALPQDRHSTTSSGTANQAPCERFRLLLKSCVAESVPTIPQSQDLVALCAGQNSIPYPQLHQPAVKPV